MCSNQLSTARMEEAVRSIVADPRQLEVRSEAISKDVIANNLDIAGLIETLGFALTSAELELRLASTQLLSAILSQLPVTQLGAAQLQFIVTFYCDRMKDHHSVAPAIFTGLLAIVQQAEFPADGASRILNALFLHISTQSQVREDRQKIFQILRVLCVNHVPELLSMGPDLVYGVIGAIDGERDPRILLYIFEFVPQFVATYPLGHLAEELFEVCACYFPVDFHPSADDPASITRDRLATELARCLAGHPEFAEHCIPLLLEKLDTQLVVAKLDSLQLLRFAAERFPPAEVEKEFAASIWTALHPEIIAAGGGKSTAQISAAALQALQAIVTAASRESDQCARNVLVSVFETIMGSLANVGANLFESSMAIAVSCAGASRFAASFVCGKVLPLLLSEVDLLATESPSRIAAIYEHMTQALEACVRFQCVAEVDEVSVREFSEKLIAGLDAGSDAALQRASLRCLSKLVGALSADSRREIYAHLNRLLVADIEGDCGPAVNQLLIALASEQADEVRQHILGQWIEATQLQPSNARSIIPTVAGLVRIEAFRDSAIAFLFRHSFAGQDVAVADVALASLQLVVQGASADLFEQLYASGAILEQLVQFIRSADRQHSAHTLGQLSGCLQTVVQRVAVSEQFAVIGRYLPAVDFAQTRDVYLAVGLLSRASAEVAIHPDVLDRLLLELTRIALRVSEDQAVVDICRRTLCSLANKAQETEAVNALLVRIVEHLQRELAEENAEQAFAVLGWLAKGLLLRGHATGFGIVELLLAQTARDADRDRQIVGAFDVITAAEEEASLHLPVTRFLHRQKLLQFVLAQTEAQTTETRIRVFAYVLRWQQLPALTVNLQRILPLIFRGLGDEEARVVQIFVGVIDVLVAAKNEVISGHLNRLIPLYLRLCCFKGSMKIRIAALQGLLNLTSYPTIALTPYKQDVLYSLAAPLDDPKRLVRNAAVTARNKWFLV